MRNFLHSRHFVPTVLASLFCCFAIILFAKVIPSGSDATADDSIQAEEPAADAANASSQVEELFVVVEDMPKMVGGPEALAQRVKYPDLARRAGIEGRVVVQFVVDASGQARDVQVIRGIGAGCDEEAVRAISETEFVPGHQRGQAVNVRMTVPIQFRLDA
ncbi:MAG: TonB family protein [Bacteroidetes bacterium]|nr:TonB family protein [Bacteroidota bacterium]